jgi:la-related protein 1
MDSQGFVLLSFILNFNRIKQLTTDAELVRAACWRSPIIEFQQGVEDGKDRIRPMREWQNWVLPMQERAPEAQHDGPTSVQTPQLQYAPNQMFPGPMPPMGASSPASQGGLQYSPEHGSVNGGHPVPPHNGDGTITQTPLSAAVPDFTPSMPSMLPSHSESAINSTADSTFPDEQIGSLTIVVKKELSEPSGVESPPAATRTFSNGSLDPHAISDDVSGLRLSDQPTGGTTNGDPAPER